VKALKQQLEQRGDKKQATLVGRKLDDVVAEVRAKTTAQLIDSLREQQSATAKQVGAVDERIRIAAADLAALKDRLRRHDAITAQLELLNTLMRELDDAIAARKN